MSEFSLFHWLAALAVILLLFGGGKFRNLGGGSRGGGPSHPLPVTSPVETPRGSANLKE
jgi:hypothetical protein